ncbi:Uncharacterised protein [uncultured archaeon]|nr:Uncharacterised protein [uncultured archaeon]
MDTFTLKLLLSFAVGGAYIAFTIWVSEKFGSKLGGIAIGLPSTALVSFIFIAWTQDLNAAVAAAPITPLGTAATALFLAFFVHFYKFGRVRSLVLSILLWAVITFPFAFLRLDNMLYSLPVAAVLLAITISYLSRFPHRRLPAFRLPPGEFLFRSAFAGTIVAAAVLFSKLFGPEWGGLFAAFPAAFSSSVFLLSRKHGLDFTASVARSMPFGSIANVVFEAGFFLFALPLGLFGGIALAYSLSLSAALLLYRFFMK